MKPDEFPAVLQKGEGVFTKGQMQAMGGTPNVNVVIHNESGTEAKMTKQDVTFDGQTYVVSLWLDAYQRNKMGLRSLVGG